jgi:hypothetical protein
MPVSAAGFLLADKSPMSTTTFGSPRICNKHVYLYLKALTFKVRAPDELPVSVAGERRNLPSA